MLTEKENYLRMLRGEMPEFLPKYDMMGWGAPCSLFSDLKNEAGTKVNEFGVEYSITKESVGAVIPTPGKYVLDDITKWRDVIKTPDISDVDWEKLAKKDLEGKNPDNPLFCYCGPQFMNLIDFMGFTEGLCAIQEEPEEVYALFEYLTKYNLEKQKKLIKYYKPDIFCLCDDTAMAKNPFISLEAYRTLIKPFQKLEADLALENGMLLTMHNCGRCEDQIEDWIEMGVTGWDPAQISNDLLGIKKKYGRKLVLNGCWDSNGPVSWPSTDDKILMDALVEYVDTYAPGGAFAFGAHVMGVEDDTEAKRKSEMINKFYWDYARDWYKNHGEA